MLNILPKTVCTPPSQVTSEIMIATNWIYNSHVRYVAVYQIIYTVYQIISTGMFCSIHVIKYSVLINVILNLIM